MRGREDLLPVRFNLECGLTLDRERVQQDPVFQMIVQRSSTDQEAVVKYVIHYLQAETILADMPSTNGPADLFRIAVDTSHLESILASMLESRMAESRDVAASALPSFSAPLCLGAHPISK